MPQKLGQHFLKNKSKIKKIVEVIDLQEDDFIFEVGPGHGELTKEIIQEFENKNIKKYKLISIEKDIFLVPNLKDLKGNNHNFEVIADDVRHFFPNLHKNYKKLGNNFKIVGNIPYYLTGFLLRIISELESSPQKTILLIQKEVAERISAISPNTNLLSASVGYWASSKIITTIPKNDFSPPPKVESAVICLDLLENNKYVSRISKDKYYLFIKKLFKQPRKTISNNLRTKGVNQKEVVSKLEEIGINPSSRPQDLSINEIINISLLF